MKNDQCSWFSPEQSMNRVYVVMDQGRNDIGSSLS